MAGSLAFAPQTVKAAQAAGATAPAQPRFKDEIKAGPVGSLGGVRAGFANTRQTGLVERLRGRPVIQKGPTALVLNAVGISDRVCDRGPFLSCTSKLASPQAGEGVRGHGRQLRLLVSLLQS